MTACDLACFLHKQRQHVMNKSDRSSNGQLQGGKKCIYPDHYSGVIIKYFVQTNLCYSMISHYRKNNYRNC